MENTSDLSKFGMRELAQAGELLTAYAQEQRTVADLELNDGVHVEFNPMSGNVFLVDEDYNVAMLNDDGKLENWVSCPNCGFEDWKHAFPTPPQREPYKGLFECPQCKENW